MGAVAVGRWLYRSRMHIARCGALQPKGAQQEEPPHRLPEYNGAVPVEDDAVLYVPAYGTRQYLRFGVAAEADEIAGRHGVVHPCHVLFDDRAFVEIGGD